MSGHSTSYLKWFWRYDNLKLAKQGFWLFWILTYKKPPNKRVALK